MRRSEITPELIELSKRAKELGFPQDVERGDWVLDEDKGILLCVTNVPLACHEFDAQNDNYFKNFEKEDDWFFILSFSRCLEWLREQGCYTWLVGFTEKDTKPLFVHVYRGNEIFEGEGKSIEECGAKAVVKILEEEG